MAENDRWHDVVELAGATARIAHAMDSAPGVGDLMALLAPGIQWSFGENLRTKAPSSTLDGADAVQQWATSRRESKNQGPDSGTRHVVTNQVADFTGDDTATVLSYFSFYGTTAEGTVLNAVGTYRDDFTRVGGRWLLASRLIQV